MAPWPCQKVKVELTPCLNVSQALSLGGCCAMGTLPQNTVEGVPPQSFPNPMRVSLDNP